MKKKSLLNTSLKNSFFYQFVKNFLELLVRKINVFYIFNMVDFFSNFCYATKFWNFYRIELSVKTLRAIHF